MVTVCFSSGEIKLSSRAAWSEKGVTVAGQANGTPGSSLSHLNSIHSIPITRNDVLYISDRSNHRIVVVHLNSTKNPFVIGSGPGAGINQLKIPHGIYTTDTSLYVIDLGNQRVQKLSLNDSSLTLVTHLSGLNSPYYLFVDKDDDTYLSDTKNHQVLLFRSGSTVPVRVAGIERVGSDNNQLNQPCGIFVNHIGTVYIADWYNHRIMKWLAGASTGIRVAGDGTPGSSSMQLNLPTQVLVDANEYMYISESGNSRITRWAPSSTYGVCIVACTGTAGTASTQLHVPVSLAFDSND